MAENVQYYGYNDSSIYEIYPKMKVSGFVPEDAPESVSDASGVAVLSIELNDYATENSSESYAEGTGPVYFDDDKKMRFCNKLDLNGADIDASMVFLNQNNTYTVLSKQFSYSNNEVVLNCGSDSIVCDVATGELSVKNWDTISEIIDLSTMYNDSSDGSAFIIVGMKDDDGNSFKYLDSSITDNIIKNTIGGSINASYSADVSTQNLYLVGVTESSTNAYKTIDSVEGKRSVYVKNYCVYQTSDDREKDYVSDLSVSLEDVSKIKKARFLWKGGDGTMQIGVSAQSVAEVFPEVVSENNGRLSVSYEKLSVIALSAIDSLSKKISELEKRVADLESEKK